MLFEPLFAHAEKTPDEIAVVDDRGQYTYKQLSAAAAGLGLYLGMQTDQNAVGLLLPPSAGFVASFYGTLLSGKTVVPINYLLGDREIAHVVKDSGIDTVVTIPQLAGRLENTDLKVIDLTALPQTPPFAITPKFPSPAADDTAVILYTSGTSGLPKGVMLTYNNLQSDVEAAIVHADLQERHTFLGIVPLFHSTGLLATMIAPVQLGTKVVYIARFSPVATLNAVREHKLSVLVAVPSMYGALLRLKDASPADFAHVYACLSGGEPLPSTIREGWRERFTVPILEGYGLTETIGPIAFNTPQNQRPGAVGRLIPGAEVKIVDDNGATQNVHSEGEVWLKGPMIMKGYHNLPTETADVLTADGFFKSGDLGKVDDDGYLHITGRKKELIIVAGEKAVPREIEETLMQHPAVAMAAVVGKKDPSRGEVVVAFVTLKQSQTATPEELRNFVRDRNLPGFKVPREVFVVDELPISPTGKVLKRVLADKVNAPPAP